MKQCKIDLTKLDHFALEQLIVDAAKELTTREKELYGNLILIAAEGTLSFAHQVLASHHLQNAIVSSQS
jgi:hypothetical protein